MRSGFDEITLVQRLGQAAIFLTTCKRKVARHKQPAYRYYSL
jgi:hypothetical protein